MTDEVKNTIGQVAAWFTAIWGAISFEMWLGLAGLAVSAFIALTNYRSRKLQDRLLREEADRSVELHALEMQRLRMGLSGISPAVPQSCVKDFIAEAAAAKAGPTKT